MVALSLKYVVLILYTCDNDTPFIRGSVCVQCCALCSLLFATYRFVVHTPGDYFFLLRTRTWYLVTALCG